MSKDFLTLPACSDIKFNPPTCYDCGKVVIEGSYFCDKCVVRRRDILKLADDKRLAPKLPDRNYSRIIFASVWLITFGYLLLIYWCLTR